MATKLPRKTTTISDLIREKNRYLYGYSPCISSRYKGKLRSESRLGRSSNNALTRSTVQEHNRESANKSYVWYRYLGANNSSSDVLHSCRPYGPGGREFLVGCDVCGGLRIHDMLTHQKLTPRHNNHISSGVDPDDLNRPKSIFEKIAKDFFGKRMNPNHGTTKREDLNRQNRTLVEKKHRNIKKGRTSKKWNKKRNEFATPPCLGEERIDKSIDPIRGGRNYQRMHERRQEALRVLQRTGRRARRPSDVMEVVSYLDTDNDQESLGNSSHGRGKVGRGSQFESKSSPREFDCDYAREGLKQKGIKRTASPSRRRNSPSRLEELRKHSVNTWLERRGCPPTS